MGFKLAYQQCDYKKPDCLIRLFSYAHMFDSCIQDWFAVSSILENLFHNIVKTSPNIKNVYLHSDKAGCYHNNKLIASVSDIGKRAGLTVCAYDFSEPQHGKDVCDRILCPMKNSLKTYCNEGHNIVCAAHRREALKEMPVRGSTASVCQMDVNNKTLNMKNISNFSAFHNFRFEVDGIRMWNAFTVGTGKLIPYDKLYVTSQKACGLVVGCKEDSPPPPPDNQEHLNQAKNILKITTRMKGMAILYAWSKAALSHLIP